MENRKFRQTLHSLCWTLLLSLLMSCAAQTGGSNDSQGGHASSGVKKGSFFSLFDNGLKLGKKAYGEALNGLDMLKVRLKGEKGTWTPELSRMAKSEVETHPNLINGINGQNPMRGICDNYLNMKPSERVNVMIAVAASIAYGEGHFGTKGHGGERNSYLRARGRFQISNNAEAWGCWTSGYRPLDDRSSLDCVYKIMDGQFQQGKPIANDKSHWSVLMPSKYLEKKFMSSFTVLAPQCTKDYEWTRSKAYPGPEIINPRIIPPANNSIDAAKESLT